MKHQSILSFQKHIETLAKEKKLLPVLLIVPDAYERGELIKEVISNFDSLKGACFNRYTLEKRSMKEIVQELEMPSLLGGSTCQIIDDLHLGKKAELSSFCEYLEDGDFGNIFLGAKEKVSIQPLISIMDRLGVLLDLSMEKPWDREKRIIDHLYKKALKERKRVSKDLLKSFILRVGIDLALLESEMDKLFTYIGEREDIVMKDILTICPESVEQKVWLLADKMIWQDISLPENVTVDASFFHSLIPALRYQLQLGYKLLSLEKCSTQEVVAKLKKVSPRVIEKKRGDAKRLKESFFQKGLTELFAIDLLSKDQVLCYRSLIDLFQAKCRTYRGIG